MLKKIICIFGFVIMIFTFSFSKEKENNLDKMIEELESIEIEATPIFEKDKTGSYVIYFDKEIGEPFEYRALVTFLNNAKSTDTIIFKINTFGGNAISTITIINAIKSCPAMTIAEIQTGYSAGGIIAMSCKRKIVLPYATMMIHSVQSGSQGSINNMKLHIDCWQKLNNDIIRNTFKNFLTENEINYVNNGGIFWMNEDEIKSRLKK